MVIYKYQEVTVSSGAFITGAEQMKTSPGTNQ